MNPYKQLISLPDLKSVHKHLTVGSTYEILRTVGNGVVIRLNEETELLILASRFE